LAGSECDPASDYADKRRTEDTSATVQCHHEYVESDKEWQGVHCRREDQPAEQANASEVQE
jgi:hypothetical protein